MNATGNGRFGMIEAQGARAVVSRDDLLAAVDRIEARENDAEEELARLIVVRRLVAASFELSRTLRAQTQSALVNHCGSPGSRGLREATELLWDAISAYARRCREVADDARATGRVAQAEDRRHHAAGGRLPAIRVLDPVA